MTSVECRAFVIKGSVRQAQCVRKCPICLITPLCSFRGEKGERTDKHVYFNSEDDHDKLGLLNFTVWERHASSGFRVLSSCMKCS